MKKITLIISIIAVSLSLLFTSCNAFAKDIKGNGKLVTKSIAIANFSEMEIETAVVVNYSQAENTGNLEFTVDENLFEYYDIYTKDNVLNIKLKKEYKNVIHPKPSKSVITVSSEQLEDIEIAGSSIFHFCTDFTARELSIDLAGSAIVSTNKNSVYIEQCEIEIAGSGQVQLKGTIQEAEIDIAGSGQVDALNCKISKLEVEIAGSGSVKAHVINELEVEIAGSGKVQYKGNPVVSKDIAGSGKVVKL